MGEEFSSTSNIHPRTLSTSTSSIPRETQSQRFPVSSSISSTTETYCNYIPRNSSFLLPAVLYCDIRSQSFVQHPSIWTGTCARTCHGQPSEIQCNSSETYLWRRDSASSWSGH